MTEDLYELFQKREEHELAVLLDCNQRTKQYGLSLTQEEATELVACRNQSLKKYQRIEFGKGILDNLIDAFYDSQYINQTNYLETLTSLQDIFYLFKNESQDKLTDMELIDFMQEQFEYICMGDVEYLADTCLERFSRAVRNGYEGYKSTQGKGEYEKLSEEERWDDELYMQVARQLFWE